MAGQNGDAAARGAGRWISLLDLKDEAEAIARYEAAHRPGNVPPAVLKSIRAAGITAMSLYRASNRLVMVIETDASFDARAKAEADAADDAVVAWEARMDTLQQRLPFAAPGDKWVRALPIFDLSEHPACG